MADEKDENQPSWSEKQNNFSNVLWLSLILSFGLLCWAESPLGWDIGAYEYVQGGDTTPPAAPRGLGVR